MYKFCRFFILILFLSATLTADDHLIPTPSITTSNSSTLSRVIIPSYNTLISQPNLVTNNTTTTVGVKGMVCSFCAQGLKVAFEEYDAVKNVTISLETKTITLELYPGMTFPKADINTLIESSGFQVAEMHDVRSN